MAGAVTVMVYKKKDGYPAKGTKVKGYYAGIFMTTYPTQEVKTDSSGRAVLTWDSDPKYLVEIYIAGEKHKGKFLAGSTQSFQTTRG